MSFGRRHPQKPAVPHVEKSKPSLASRVVTGVIALSLAAGLCASGYVFRHTLAMSVYPQALASMAPHGKQLRGDWDESAPDSKTAASTIEWTLKRMAEMCGDHAWLAKNEALEEFAKLNNLTVQDPGSKPNLYGDASMSAVDMIEGLKGNALKFCAADYFVVSHDGRRASVVYLKRSSEAHHAKLKQIDEVQSLMQSFVNKTKSLGRMPVDDELTEDEKLVDSCFKANSGSGDPKPEKVVDCFIHFKALKANVVKSEAQVATEILKRAVRDISASRSGAAGETSEPVATHYASRSIDIRRTCLDTHQSNYVYRDICEKKQEEAKRDINRMSVPVEVAQYCDGVHDTSYVYRKICYEKQIEAKGRRSY